MKETTNITKLLCYESLSGLEFRIEYGVVRGCNEVCKRVFQCIILKMFIDFRNHSFPYQYLYFMLKMGTMNGEDQLSLFLKMIISMRWSVLFRCFFVCRIQIVYNQVIINCINFHSKLVSEQNKKLTKVN